MFHAKNQLSLFIDISECIVTSREECPKTKTPSGTSVILHVNPSSSLNISYFVLEFNKYIGPGQIDHMCGLGNFHNFETGNMASELFQRFNK